MNLLKPSEDLEREYDFRFLTETEAREVEGFFWFECSQILEITDMSKTSMYLMKNRLMDTSLYSEGESEFAINTLNGFFNVIHQKGTISAYLEEDEEIDKVLQIFIRINSGGTKLSYSDFLLSIATAQWGEKDAREEIHAFVDKINKIGDGFDFSKDNVLKACLVLENFDVKFKSDNFTKENMARIERNWERISEAIEVSVRLISAFGYCKDNLLSSNIIVPIAHYVYANKFENEILHSKDRKADREFIREWLARVTLKGTFSSSTDSIYPVLREIINSNLGKFPLSEIIEHYKGRSRSLIFSNDDIDNLLDLKYGGAKAYAALTLLYPGLNYSYKYHQDHIHPQSFFKSKSLKKRGIDEDRIELFVEKFNLLPNIQLLHGTTNSEKSDKAFSEWLNESFEDQASRNGFLIQNHIPVEQTLRIEDFLSFFDARRAVMKNILIKLLNETVENIGN